MYMVTSTVPFNMIVDTDLGLWKLIQDQYPNINFFYQGLIYERDLNFMKHFMVSRMEKNPLKSLMKPDYVSQADSLYDEFINTKYDEILRLSENTGIFELICRSKGVNDVMRFTVLCQSQVESDEIFKRFSKYNMKVSTIIYEDLKKVDISQYGSIYIKDIHDFFSYNRVEGKNVIVGNYGFNLEGGVRNTTLLEPSGIITLSNVIQLIDIYLINEHTLPVG